MTRIYEVNQKAAKLQIGDRVEVFRSCKNEENGWPNIWADQMNYYIGKAGIITGIASHGIRIDFEISHHPMGGRFTFPYFCLKMVR